MSSYQKSEVVLLELWSWGLPDRVQMLIQPVTSYAVQPLSSLYPSCAHFPVCDIDSQKLLVENKLFNIFKAVNAWPKGSTH